MQVTKYIDQYQFYCTEAKGNNRRFSKRLNEKRKLRNESKSAIKLSANQLSTPPPPPPLPPFLTVTCETTCKKMVMILCLFISLI